MTRRWRCWSVRLVAGAAAVALLPLMPSSVLPSARAAQRDYFQVPAAAYSNGLGRFPNQGPCSPYMVDDMQCTPQNALGAPLPAEASGGNPAVQPGLGVPLGGVGAGSFMINQAGTFGPWNFGGPQDVNFENRILPQAAFHVREQVTGSAPTVRTLATNAGPWGGVLPAWKTLQPGDGTYSALWPFGWTTYQPFQADVSMKFWSPIVAGNDELTSMPVAYFDIRLANHTGKADKISTMFTMPNAPEHSGQDWIYPLAPLNPATVRTGLSSTFSQDKKTGVSGVTLSASSPQNTQDAQNSDWTIAALPAAGQNVSYTTSWNGSGSGSDVYSPFTATGSLPNAPLDDSASAGAIAVSVTLQPGQTTEIPFALAWDFPQVQSIQGDFGGYFMRRYTSYFGAQETAVNDYVPGSYPSHQGFRIADTMLGEHNTNLAAVDSWASKIVDNPKYPGFLVREALNEDTHMVFNDSFWESGLITSTPSPPTRIGSAVPGNHIFCFDTNAGYGGCDEWDVDAQGYTAEELLWPDLEKGRLIAVAQEQLQNVSGGMCCTSAVNGIDEPYRTTTGSVQFQDIPMKAIFRDWALWQRTGDTAFFKYAYPEMLELTKILQAGIKPGDHIPPDYPGQSATYDVMEVVGHGIYNSGLWLLTEQIMADATQEALKLGVPDASSAFEQALRTDLPQAKAEFQTLFWDPVTQHYKIDPVGSHPGYFVDSAYGQHIATTLGLPPMMNDQDLVTHMIKAYPQFMQDRDSAGNYIGPPNIAPLVGPIPPTLNEVEPEDNLVWTGSATTLAATYISEGRRLGNYALVGDGLEIERNLEKVFDDPTNGYLFNRPEYWLPFDETTYAWPGGNRVRAAMDVLNSLYPVLQAEGVCTPAAGSTQCQ